MQLKGSRLYRVKAVAEALDVHPATVYRAVESGQLDAFKLGAGSGAIRIPGYAIEAWLEKCGQAAYQTFVVDGQSADQGTEGVA